MWRYVVGGVAALLLAAAGMLIFDRRGDGRVEAASALALSAPTAVASDDPLPADLPAASEKTREQRRFDRYDKDRDAKVTRDEFLASRRKAFAKLDTNGDGRLSFDEWAVKTTVRFAQADRDRSGALTAAEFAATAPRRRTKAKTQPACVCPPAAKDDE